MALRRGALDLIATYDDNESSDEDIPGSRVSTKRTFKETDEKSRKRLQRLPVPEIVINKVKLDEPPTEDPRQHDRRIRSFPHVRGNWATYVYIPYEPSAYILHVVTFIVNHVESLKLQPVDDFHISLTKTIILKYHWINSFIESLKECFSSTKRFIIFFDTLEVYSNEERTRTFLGLTVKSGMDTLENIVQNIDHCLEEFKLPTFFKIPSFHMSIAWCVGDRVDEIQSILPDLNAGVAEAMNNFPQSDWYILVTSIICKTGNKLFSFNLH